MSYHSPIKALPPGTRIGSVTIGGLLFQTPMTLHYAINGQDDALVELAPAGAAKRGEGGTLSVDASAISTYIAGEGVDASEAIKENGTLYVISPHSHGKFLNEALNKVRGGGAEDIRALLLSIGDQLREKAATGKHHGALSAASVFLAQDGKPHVIGWGDRPAADALGMTLDASNGLKGEASDVYALSEIGYLLVTGQAPMPYAQRTKALEDGLSDPLVPAGEYADAAQHGSLIRAISRGLSLNNKPETKTFEDWAFTVEGRSRLMNDGTGEAPIVETNPRPAAASAQTGASTGPRPMRPKRGTAPVQPQQQQAGLRNIALLLVGLAVLTGLALFFSKSDMFAPKDEAEIAAPEPAGPNPQEERAWVNARTIDSLGSYNTYLERYPTGFYVEEANQRLDALDDIAWQAAITQNTLDGYKAYIEAYPLGLHVPEAQQVIDRIEAGIAAMNAADNASWRDAQRIDTVASYDAYLSAYPDGQYVPEARDRRRARLSEAQDDQAFEAAESIGTGMAYQSYLNRFPGGKHAAKALAMVDRMTTRTGDVFKDCPQCPDMVVIGSGTFKMGAGEDDPMAKPSEKPQHNVTIPAAFALGQAEVTVGQWKACAAAGACRYDPKQGEDDTKPVTYVSWDDAKAYAAWLSKVASRPYRLPSEAEWEYAARAGTQDIYPGGRAASVCRLGNIAGAETNYPWRNTACDDGAGAGVEATRRRQANAFGLYDMTGNAAEWTQDCASLSYRDAPTSGAANERGLCSSRIARGGSWISGPRDFRLAARMVRSKGDTDDTTGFRVALTLPK